MFGTETTSFCHGQELNHGPQDWQNSELTTVSPLHTSVFSAKQNQINEYLKNLFFYKTETKEVVKYLINNTDVATKPLWTETSYVESIEINGTT